MLWLIYNVLFVIGFSLMLPRFLYRMARRGGYARNFSQRFGNYEPDVLAKLKDSERIWIHAVSVGEFFVALRLMDELRSAHPGVHFVLTTTTSTGHALAAKKLNPEDVLLYFPLDVPPIMSRVFRLIQPKALILIELELWPNLIRYAKRAGIPVVLVNGRLSEHSYKGYKKLRLFTRKILGMVDLLCVQSTIDQERLVDLGAPAEKTVVLGSAKYDLTPPVGGASLKAHAVLESAGFAPGRMILLGGSTWAGEEAVLLDVYQELRKSHPELALVLVPRHVERTSEILKVIEAKQLHVVRRTELARGQPVQTPDLLLVDTTGELLGFYACADVIFVGKSLTRHGGQNVIEPAFFGKPVVVGPNMENFASVMGDFLSANAMVQVRDVSELQSAVESLVVDAGRRSTLGHAAAEVVRAKAGAVHATAGRLIPLLFGPSISRG